MSLYDDIIPKKDLKSSATTSSIKLLHEHLELKRKTAAALASKTEPPKPPPTLKAFLGAGGPGGGVSAALAAKAKNAATVHPMVSRSSPPSSYGYSHSSSKPLFDEDWDQTLEYDPMYPNDYEKIKKERREKREREKEALERAKAAERERRERDMSSGVITTVGVLRGMDTYSDDDDDQDNVVTSRDGDKDDPRDSSDRSRNRDHSRSSHGSSRSSSKTGAAIAPPRAILEDVVPSQTSTDQTTTSTTSSSFGNFGASSVAAKIMAKMGYREGSGLGKEGQGISQALSVQKTGDRHAVIVSQPKESPAAPSSSYTTTSMPPPPPPPSAPVVAEKRESDDITEMMKLPSKVVLLRNMVEPAGVDEFLGDEIKEECEKYGQVTKCHIHQSDHDKEFPVRIFVEFQRVDSAIKALVDLNGRFFGGRTVRAKFYPLESFRDAKYDI